jgi:hypothetical protein
MGMRNEFNFRWESTVKIRSSKYLTTSWSRITVGFKLRVFRDAGLQVLSERKNRDRRNRTHPEAQEGQYGVPFSFGLCSRDIWSNVLAA